MDYRNRLLSLCNRIAKGELGVEEVADELAIMAGLIARDAAEDEADLEAAINALPDPLPAAARHGFAPYKEGTA